MAALGGVQVLPVDEGVTWTTVRESFVHPAPVYFTWGVQGLPWHEYLYGSTGGAAIVPTRGQIWPRGDAS